MTKRHTQEKKMKSSLKLFLGGLAVASGLTLANTKPAQATCADNPYMGTICWTMSYYCPRNYAEANGQILAISGNDALYSLLGTFYGGDGRSSFGLPDLRGRTNIGTLQGPGLSNVYLGQKIGAEKHLITVANMPAHSHTVSLGNNITLSGTVTGVSDNGSQTTPEGNFPGARPSSGGTLKEMKPYYTDGSGTNPVLMAGDSVEVTVNPSKVPTEPAFDNISQQEALPLRAPQVGVRACIAMKGTYPPRS